MSSDNGKSASGVDRFSLINPTDFRYYLGSDKAIEDLEPYLSENGMISYMAKAESALGEALAAMNICSSDIAKEISKACEEVTADEVYAEEGRIKHNVRALANMIRKRVSDKAKPYVHFTATSHDIICSADAARYRDAALQALVPSLKELLHVLIKMAEEEKSTIQIGRTHGQHAEPLTVGFALAEYVSRLGTRIEAIISSASNLRGKLSGAIGAYNQSSLFVDDPEKLESLFLAKQGLKPATHSTQIVEPEYMADFVHAVISCFGVLASLSDDMRHLQRSEIREMGEAFGKNQVGSSTMPHKRNPINFENVKSLWKVAMPRIITMYLDQPSEHQRDLTNSASSRYHTETVALLYLSAKRLTKTMGKLQVDPVSLKRNFEENTTLIPAEPLYLLLAGLGHPDAHEAVRKITLKVKSSGKSVLELAKEDKDLASYLKRMDAKQQAVLEHPSKYIGIAVKKTEKVCSYWKRRLE